MNNNNLMVTITIVVLLILIIIMIIHDRYIKKEKFMGNIVSQVEDTVKDAAKNSVKKNEKTFNIDEDKAKEMGIDKALKVLKDIQENETLNIKNLNVTEKANIKGKKVKVHDFIGCYKDKKNRGIPKKIADRLTKEQCKKKAKEKGYKFYGMQYPQINKNPNIAQCFGGNEYNKHGPKQCTHIYNDKGELMGGVWENAVYRV